MVVGPVVVVGADVVVAVVVDVVGLVGGVVVAEVELGRVVDVEAERVGRMVGGDGTTEVVVVTVVDGSGLEEVELEVPLGEGKARGAPDDDSGTVDPGSESPVQGAVHSSLAGLDHAP